MRRKTYDEERLVELLGLGTLTHRQIGEQVGLSASFVSRVARGRAREELQPRIRESAARHREEVRQAGARWLRALVARHVQLGMTDTGETGRKCREFAISTFLDSPGEAVAQAVPSVELNEEDYRAIALLKQGPALDDSL